MFSVALKRAKRRKKKRPTNRQENFSFSSHHIRSCEEDQNSVRVRIEMQLGLKAKNSKREGGRERHFLGRIYQPLVAITSQQTQWQWHHKVLERGKNLNQKLSRWPLREDKKCRMAEFEEELLLSLLLLPSLQLHFSKRNWSPCPCTTLNGYCLNMIIALS